MTFSSDIAGDYAYFDGLEAVTLYKTGTTATTAVASALRRSVTTKEAAASKGRYTMDDVNWHLPVALVSAQPGLGDRVLDSSGVYWTILQVNKETLGTRWRCLTRDLAVAHRLDCLVAIERGLTLKGKGGAAELDWEECRAGVRARIQPTGGSEEVENRSRIERVSHQVFCELAAGEIAGGSRYRVRDEAGQLYHLVRYLAPESISELLRLEVMKTPWPLA